MIDPRPAKRLARLAHCSLSFDDLAIPHTAPLSNHPPVSGRVTQRMSLTFMVMSGVVMW